MSSVDPTIHGHRSPPAPAPEPRPAETLADAPRLGESGTTLPERIGEFRVLGLVGMGGMGVVYRAEQSHPRRTVAIKVLRPGSLSRDALKRFEREAAVLGALNHPGIAHVFQAGVHDDRGVATPYFAMEFIEGQPIDVYADRAGLDARARADLVAHLCDAVQHAHERGVIHRDLKPANVLVDDSGRPRILDFGVARAVNSDLRATTIHTDVGQLIGTVPYMSPEQVAGDPAAIDERTDVYALGVILYELLAHRLPFDFSRIAIHEAARIIREDDPATLASINRTLRGDVDTIVGKALEKEKDRRYDSAAALASDLRRWLGDLPIVARPPSTVYQLRKFARRNRGLVAGVAAAFVVLVAGLVGVSLALARAVAAESLATERLAAEQTARAEADRQSAEARTQAQTAAAIVDFLNEDLLAAAQPEAQGKDVSMLQALDAAAASIAEGALAEEPVALGAVRTTLGVTYERLGRYQDAAAQLEASLALRTERLGPDHPDTLETARQLAGTYVLLARFEDADRLFASTAAASAATLGPEHIETLLTRVEHAGVLRERDRVAEAEPMLVSAVEAITRTRGEDSPDTARAVLELGLLYSRSDRLDEAASLYERGLAIRSKHFDEGHPATLGAKNNLAALYWRQGRHAEGERLHTEVLEARKVQLGPEHPETIVSMNNLALVREKIGRVDEAEALLREAIELRRRSLGDDNPGVAVSHNNLGQLLRRQGRREEALEHFRTTLAIRRKSLGDSHRDTIFAMVYVGDLSNEMGLYEDAAPVFDMLVERAAETFGPTNWMVGDMHMRRGVCLRGLARCDDAETSLLKAHEILLAARGAEFDRTQQCVRELVALYEACGRESDAATWRAKLPPLTPAADTGSRAQ